MELAFVLALAFFGMFAFTNDAYAMPNETKTTEIKEVKEPKDIKEFATASKDVKNAIKATKNAKKNKKDCPQDCGSEYDPVCVHDPSDVSFKPRSFGSICSLDVYNCEMGTKLAVKSKGECPGSGGVRLS